MCNKLFTDLFNSSLNIFFVFLASLVKLYTLKQRDKEKASVSKCLQEKYIFFSNKGLQ